jgi:toxin ParE1/3/4
MQRIEVVYRPEAIADLEDIFRFVLRMNQERDTARTYIQRIRDRCHRIGDVPLGGTSRDDIYPGLRTIPFERRAVIAYLCPMDE